MLDRPTNDPGEARERLARELHFKMEHLDPTESAGWEAMSEVQKDFYRCCVDWLLVHGDDIAAALDDQARPTTT